MEQGTTSYNAWIGGLCDYDYKERVGGIAIVIEHNGCILGNEYKEF